jgi:hypothetical protein
MTNKHRINRTLFFALCIALGLFVGQQSKAEPLILIELNDSWTYDVTSNGLGLEQIVAEEVNFTVEAVDYIGEGDTQMRVNEIDSTKVVDSILAMKLEEKGFEIVEDMYNDSSAMVYIDIISIISDTVYKTSRGNLPFKRITSLVVNISIIDIRVGEDYFPDYNVTKGIVFTQLSSNPTTIETFSTGTVKLNTIDITAHTTFSDFFNETANVYFNLQFDERFEASDNFIYEDTTCRNITVTSLGARIQDFQIQSSNTHNFYQWQSHTVSFNILGNEEWVYAYDAGLPLVVEKESVALPLGVKLAVKTDPIDMTMVLTDLDLVNSDFSFDDVEDTSVFIIPVAVAIVVVVGLSDKNRKDE